MKTKLLQLKQICILLFFIIGGQSVLAQQFSISGTVNGEDNEPLIGVIVQETNTGVGAVTDENGNYSLSGNTNDGELNISARYIGYIPKQQTVPTNTTELNFTLVEDFLKLEEVVVTGTSTEVNKKNLGNAISTVNSRDLNEAGAESIDRALSGKISGALVSQNSGNPAGGMSVTLRGNSTVYGSSDPLYIVDGVIIDNSSNELVDLGGYAQNRLVDINPQDIERIEVIKGAAAAALYGSRASNGVVQIFTKKGKSGKARVSFSTSAKMNMLRKEIDENLEPFAFESPNDASNSNLVPTERYKMQDVIFGDGFGTDNHLSISGGTDKTKYYFSGSANFNEGIVNNTDFTRYTGRLNLDQEISDKLSASIGMGYTNSKSTEIPNGGISEIYGALTGFNFNNTNFNPNPDENGNYISPAGFVANPLEVVNNFDFGQGVNRFTGSGRIDYAPLNGLSMNLVTGIDTYTQNADGFIPVGSTIFTTGWARTGTVERSLLNADLNVMYKKSINKNIFSTTLVGGTVQHNDSKSLTVTSDKLSPVVNSTSAGTIISQGEYESERNIQGAFIQQSFDINDNFFVTGAMRMDQASSFGKDNRTQYYPKLSASYLLTESPILANNENINLLKLRASYGESGNLTALSAYERFSTYLPNPFNGVTALSPSTRQGNPDIKPERQKELEVGFDLGAFNNRFGIEFSAYKVDVEDLLLLRTLAPSTTFSSRLENVGNMTNKGLEFLITGVPVKNDNVTWLTSVNYSRNRNEVSGIQEAKIALPKSFGVSVARNGEPLGVLDGFKYRRNEDGSIYYDSNGLPARAVDANGAVIRETIGDPNPDYTLNWINTVDVGNFNFRAQLDAVQGFEVFNFTDRVNSRSAFGGGWRDAQEIRGELPRGFNNAAYNIWERYIEDGSFIKLRELSLGYNHKPKAGTVQNLRFALSGRNIFSIDDYSGWDPEVSTAGQTNGVRGFDFNEVPIPSTYSFTINATFN